MATPHKQPDPELIEKQLRVLELRKAGLTWEAIAAEVGYADHSGAVYAFRAAIKRVLQVPAEEVRSLEMERLDKLWEAVYSKAALGDIAAITAALKIMERRSRLQGLDAPTKISQEVTTWAGDESIDRAVRELAATLAARATDSEFEDSMAIIGSPGIPVTAE